MRLLHLPFLLCALACSTSSKATITDKAMANDGERQEIIEATLRVLDEHPEYVDELFQRTLKHPRTLNRFLGNTAHTLDQEWFAKRVAAHLVESPAGTRQVMIETLDAAQKKPATQRAIVDAMEARREIAARFLVQQPEKLGRVSKAIVQQAIDDPDTKGTIKDVMKEIVD